MASASPSTPVFGPMGVLTGAPRTHPPSCSAVRQVYMAVQNKAVAQQGCQCVNRNPCRARGMQSSCQGGNWSSSVIILSKYCRAVAQQGRQCVNRNPCRAHGMQSSCQGGNWSSVIVLSRVSAPGGRSPTPQQMPAGTGCEHQCCSDRLGVTLRRKPVFRCLLQHPPCPA